MTTQDEMLSMPTEPIDVRWRLADGGLPMRERHLRSLASMGVGAPMQSWIRTRLEYVLENHAPIHPNGVLCLRMDPEGKTEMVVEPLGTVPTLTEADLVIKDDFITGASVPGVVWVMGEKLAIASVDNEELISATATTMRDLAETLSMQVEEGAVLAEDAFAEGVEIFVTSDEFGILPIEGHSGATTDRFTKLLNKLLKPAK